METATNDRHWRLIDMFHSFADMEAAVLGEGQARSQDCKFGGSFSVWGQTYFEYYYTAIAC